MRRGRFPALLIAAALLAAARPDAAEAQRTPDVSAAQQAGQVGERFDGYLGFVGQPAAELRRQVNAVNIRRRSIYTSLAGRRGLTPQVVGIAAACVLISRVQPGETYMLSDGAWRRRGQGEPPPALPHCPRR